MIFKKCDQNKVRFKLKENIQNFILLNKINKIYNIKILKILDQMELFMEFCFVFVLPNVFIAIVEIKFYYFPEISSKYSNFSHTNSLAHGNIQKERRNEKLGETLFTGEAISFI